MLRRITLATAPAIFLVFSFLSLFAKLWVFDLFSHFRMLWAVTSLCFCVGYGILVWKDERYKYGVVWSVFALVINFSASISYWTNANTYQSFSGIEAKPEIYLTENSNPKKLLLLNVLRTNPHKEKVLEIIRETEADFVAVLEVDKNWERALSRLKDDYPFMYFVARGDNFGMAFLSKENWEEVERLDQKFINKNIGIPSSVKRIKDAEELLLETVKQHKKNEKNLKGLDKPTLRILNLAGKYELYIAHPMPPVTSVAYESRNQYLKSLSLEVQRPSPMFLIHGRPVLVAGDLNCSPFSPNYKRFLDTSGLIDSQENFGFQPTWHSDMPSLFQTSLDQVWHSKNIRTLHRETIPIYGSDHKGVSVIFE